MSQETGTAADSVQEIRVLVVDDQDMIRQGIATILRYTPGIRVVGQSADGREAIDAARRLQPDVVLMDIKMPVLGGIPATRTIVESVPDVHVIILTTYAEDELVFEGIKAGAQGYLLKDAGSDVLIEAIQGVMQGESRLDPKVAHEVLAEFQRLADLTSPAPTSQGAEAGADRDLMIEPLTPREQDVLELLAEGLSNREIGRRLYLSEGTVRNYVSAIIGKLQANDRTHAVIMALRRGLVSLDDAPRRKDTDG
jgi:DNA-binding NarL/FixJ family response regulator